MVLQGTANREKAGERLDLVAWSRLAEQAAARFGTPCYLSRWLPVERMVETQERSIGVLPVRSWLSFKTHPVPQLAREWIRSGRGVEVVSETEFVAVRGLDCPTAQLLVNGVAKHSWLGRYLAPGLQVHFDSLRETIELLPQAVEQGWRVGLRCHVPAERDARDTRYGGQFGMNEADIMEAQRYLQSAGLAVEGLHFHLGQIARHPTAYQQSVAYVVSLCERLGLTPRYLDCGGGIHHASSPSAAFDDLSSALDRAARQLPALRELWIENGAYITGGSAALVVRVLDTKDRPEGRYLICDGGRTNHALDADNGLHHMLALPTRTGRLVETTVCGPTCMTDDRLGRVTWPAGIAPGDLVVWLDAGAYHLPWETRFSHGLAAVVWADAFEHLTLARPREAAGQWSNGWTTRTA